MPFFRLSDYDSARRFGGCSIPKTLRGLSHMGRGRQKAKQAKVARELKYATSGTDLEALQAELAAERGESPRSDEERFEENDEYGDWVEDDEANQ